MPRLRGRPGQPEFGMWSTRDVGVRGRERVEPRRGAVGRAVVDEDQLELAGRHGLAEQRGDAVVDVAAGVEDRDDDAHEGCIRHIVHLLDRIDEERATAVARPCRPLRERAPRGSRAPRCEALRVLDRVGRGAPRDRGLDRVVELLERHVERHVGVPQPRVARRLGLGQAHPRHAVGGGDDPHVQRRADHHARAPDVLDELERAALVEDLDVDPARRAPGGADERS